MPIVECEQGSGVWMAARRGIVTASRCADMLAVLKKGGEAEPRRRYREELICEILTGLSTEHFVSREMQWGKMQEPFARAAYEIERNTMVETCGFVLHEELARFGASPDGLVGEDGMIQIKCPTSRTHLEWVRAGVLPEEHAPQMLAELACTKRKWSDFVSYDPRFPPHLQLFIQRFEPEPELIERLETEVARFNAEIEDALNQLPSGGGPQLVVDSLDWRDDDEVIQ